MTSTLMPLISLLLSSFVLMLGHGLVIILLPVRMGIEGLSTDSIGVVLSMFAVGLLLGGMFCRRLLARAGHIRLFATSGALCAVSVLVCGMTDNPVVWGLMRILFGFFIACASSAIDSWLSESATEQNRGQILAANQIVIMSAIFFGQFMLALGDPATETLFMIGGILMALSIVPIVMSRNTGPSVEDISPMTLKQLYILSPLGLVTIFYAGLLYWGLLAMLPVYATDLGFSGLQMSMITGAAISGAFIIQYPVGYLSDRMDRRTVTAGIMLFAVVASLLVTVFAAAKLYVPMMIATAIVTGVVASLYSLATSQTFDRVRKSEMGAAIGPLIMVYAAGAIAGPLLASQAMKYLGNGVLFEFLSVLEGTLLAFILYRMRIREALPIDAQEAYVMHSFIPSNSVDLDPRTAYQGTESESLELQAARMVLEHAPQAAVSLARSISRDRPELTIPIAAEFASREDVKIGELYKALANIQPDVKLEIAQAMAQAAPERVANWFEIATNDCDNMAEMLVNIAMATPEHSSEILISAAETMLEENDDNADSVVALAESFASSQSEAMHELRPADREEDNSEENMADIYGKLAELVPDQAADMAMSVTQAMPDAAVEITQAYVTAVSDQETEGDDTSNEVWSEEATEALVEHVSQIADALPEHAADVAGVVVESIPEAASDVVDVLQSHEQIDNESLDELTSNIEESVSITEQDDEQSKPV